MLSEKQNHANNFDEIGHDLCKFTLILSYSEWIYRAQSSQHACFILRKINQNTKIMKNVIIGKDRKHTLNSIP